MVYFIGRSLSGLGECYIAAGTFLSVGVYVLLFLNIYLRCSWKPFRSKKLCFRKYRKWIIQKYLYYILISYF